MVGSVTPVEAPDDAAFPYHAEITVVDPTLWNAEQPYLYTLVLDTPNEIITDRVGIREVHELHNASYFELLQRTALLFLLFGHNQEL